MLSDRKAGILDAERVRDELTNLMRWRLEKGLHSKYTHSLRLTNLNGVPLYDMIFATDHDLGDKIMSDVYRKAAAKFPRMRSEIRARRRDQEEEATEAIGLWSNEELLQDAPLKAGESYKRVPPTPPYGTSDAVS